MRTYEEPTESAYRRRIEFISERTKIPLKRADRNYQKQADHLEEARALRDLRQKRKGTNWRDGNGRKPKADVVKEWRLAHPEGRKADCIRDTGLDKKTVYKWWEIMA